MSLEVGEPLVTFFFFAVNFTENRICSLNLQHFLKIFWLNCGPKLKMGCRDFFSNNWLYILIAVGGGLIVGLIILSGVMCGTGKWECRSHSGNNGGNTCHGSDCNCVGPCHYGSSCTGGIDCWRDATTQSASALQQKVNKAKTAKATNSADASDSVDTFKIFNEWVLPPMLLCSWLGVLFIVAFATKRYFFPNADAFDDDEQIETV